MRPALLALAIACAVPALGGPRVAAADGRVEIGAPSELARPLIELHAQEPVLILAQRAIERSWGPSEAGPTPAEAAGLKSEGRAVALSMALPGAGQIYAEQMSGVWFALAEIAGWTGHVLFTRDADRQRDKADGFVGVPTDSGSAWSYDRWLQAAPGRDPTGLEILYTGDKESFYNLIVRDDTYLDGWSGPDRAQTRADFQHFRDLSDGSLKRVRMTHGGLWFNHLAAAVDALRAARIHNLPIRRNLELQLKSSWQGGAPVVAAIVERKF